MYINTIEKFKEYVSVNNDLKYDSIGPYENQAITKYFINWMSQALITLIDTFEASPAGSIQRQGYDYFLGSLCKFTLLEYIPIAEVQIGDGGITRKENDNVKTAYANQIKKLNQNLENNAYLELDRLIDLMNANPAIFTEWATSPGALLNSKCLIKSSIEFVNEERLYRPNITFIQMIPNMKHQQNFYLVSAIDAALLTELIDNDGLSPEKAQVRAYLVSALVQFTLSRGIKTGLVKLTREGVRIFEDDEESSKIIETAPDLVGAGATYNEFLDTGHRYINQALKYMEGFPEEFPTEDVDECPPERKSFWL